MSSGILKYRLSIIIPVYNVENFIEECLDSVFLQLPDLVEILIINDGTPDQSIEIIRSKYVDWLAKDQVVLIEQENLGPGAARNKGLSVARGEYVGFLDSDDVLLENYFSVVLDIINRYKIDIVEFGFKRFHELIDIQNSCEQPLYPFAGIYEVKEIRNGIFSEGVWFPSIRVYKKKIFENNRFPEGIFYEDLMTIPFIYLKDLMIYFIESPLIGYRHNPSSTTALHSKSHAIDLYEFYLSLKEIEHTTAINILKIKVARSIVYFSNELGLTDIPIVELINDMNQIPKNFGILRILKYPDLLFFILPRVYMIIDSFRFKKKMKRN